MIVKAAGRPLPQGSSDLREASLHSPTPPGSCPALSFPWLQAWAGGGGEGTAEEMHIVWSALTLVIPLDMDGRWALCSWVRLVCLWLEAPGIGAVSAGEGLFPAPKVGCFY